MENFTLNTIVDYAKAHGFLHVIGEYIPTKKNGIVRDHYALLGFEPIDGMWELDVAKYRKRDTFVTAKNELWTPTVL
jgi:predicted enzyme involved in methoxymalonyl-ACP biosynthesis